MQPDPEREADRPIARDDAAVVIDHEYRPIGLRPIGERFRHLVVAIEDRFDGAQLGAVLVERRLTPPRPSCRQPAAAVGAGPRARHQLVDPRRRPQVDEPSQDVSEVNLRIDAVQLAGFDQRSEAGPVLGSHPELEILVVARFSPQDRC
jgi:hypothetical protein